MKNDVEEFISRRFSKDCDWLSGNCYFFSLILSNVFDGKIYYDPVDGHFLFRFYEDNEFYDWRGKINLSEAQISKFEEWSSYKNVDALHYNRILRDCIL